MDGLLNAVCFGPVFKQSKLGTRTWKSGGLEAEISWKPVLLAKATDSYFNLYIHVLFIIRVAALVTREYVCAQGAFNSYFTYSLLREYTVYDLL